MKSIKIRRISKKDAEKLRKKGLIGNGVRPIKYKYIRKSVVGKYRRSKKRI